MITVVSINRGGNGAGAGVTVLLTQLTKGIYRRTSEAELGMRLKDFVALAYLRSHPGISQHELGGSIGVDANNLVILLNELEQTGWALRRRHPGDRRRHLVDITPQGKAALAKAERAIALVEDEVLAALSTSDRAALARLLSKAIDRVPVGAAQN
jgi:DNA-binding MarR family transcriptional regulator